MPVTRRGALAGLAEPLLVPRRSRAEGVQPLRFGIMGDLSGPYRDLSGTGTLVCVNQAIAEFAAAGGTVPTSAIQADHQHKADVGTSIARQWFDNGEVDVILEVNNSAIAFAVADLAMQRDRVFLATGPASADLSGDLIARSRQVVPGTGVGAQIGDCGLWLRDGGAYRAAPSRVASRRWWNRVVA